MINLAVEKEIQTERVLPYTPPNESAPEKVPESLKPAIADFVSEQRAHWGERLVAVYIYGSVANGTAGKKPDIDAIAVIDSSTKLLDREDDKWKEQSEEKFSEREDISGADFTFISLAKLKSGAIPYWEYIIANNGVLVDGRDLSADVRLPQAREELVRLLQKGMSEKLRKTLQQTFDEYDQNHDPEQLRERSKYLAKQLFRLSRGYTILIDGTYSDIPQSQLEILTKLFPDQEAGFQEIENLRNSGTTDPKVLKEIGELAIEQSEKLDAIIGS